MTRTFTREENREFLRRAQERNHTDGEHWRRIEYWFRMKAYENVWLRDGALLVYGHTMESLSFRSWR